MTKRAEYGVIREAFMIRRFHTVGYIHVTETVGHHTANVLGMIFFLWNDNPSIVLIRHTLHHDVPEWSTGDLPAPTKWGNPGLAAEVNKVEARVIEIAKLETGELSELEQATLAYADMMDLCFKCVEEMASGNGTIEPILHRGMAFVGALLEKELKDHRPAHELMNMLLSNPWIEMKEFIHVPEKRIVTTH